MRMISFLSDSPILNILYTGWERHKWRHPKATPNDVVRSDLTERSRSNPSSLRINMSGTFTVCTLWNSANSNLFKIYHLQKVKVVNSPASTYSVCDNGVLTMSNLVIDNCNDDFHSSVFLQSNNFQLREMSQIIKAEDFQLVYIHGCKVLKIFFYDSCMQDTIRTALMLLAAISPSKTGSST